MDRFGFEMGSFPGSGLENWPRGADGEFVPPVKLAHRRSNDMDDIMLVNMLSAYGIPAIRVYPGDGVFGKIVLGMSGTGADILVPENMYEDAKALMEAESDDELQS